MCGLRAQVRNENAGPVGGVVAFAVLAAFAARPEVSRATVLIFDQSRSATGTLVVPVTSGASVPQDYGDRVAQSPQTVPGGAFTYGEDGEGFTPNVVAAYFTDSDTTAPRVALWQADYGDLMNVMFGLSDSGALNVGLTADAGFDVLLYHFDLGGWSHADYTIAAVRVLDGATPLFEQSNVLVQGDATGPGHTAFDFPTPLNGSDLRIRIEYGNLAAGQQDNIGLDNIRFGQTPEPAAPAVLGLFTAAAALARRRRAARTGRGSP
jgi:hypothetical protein